MPHLTLEYSANLVDDPAFSACVDVKALCRELAACLTGIQDAGRPVYPIGGIRVRAFAAQAYCIADGAADAAFLHGTLRIGAGRSDAIRKATGDALFNLIKAQLAPLYEKTGLALSLEIIESSEAASWKHNNLHARFR
ncbi:5-carboxymethyl-2-hydroxymuconate Delta-isomerase [Herbaspirillum sp. NPDC087042]|uniref:5-carboxymethyl-2-hydroxymuconate Delta-isomerase n=1 Tax=Herbaspirillum sp. NPDC087042 TaxID=3364004 RepID=UPI003824121D